MICSHLHVKICYDPIVICPHSNAILTRSQEVVRYIDYNLVNPCCTAAISPATCYFLPVEVHLKPIIN